MERPIQRNSSSTRSAHETEAFVKDFVEACNKVMNLDRYDLT